MAVNVGSMTALARKIVAGNTGYNQARRWAFYDRATDTFIPNKATDCSAMTGAIARAGTKKVNLGTDHAGFYTGNIEQILTSTGEFTGMAYPGAGAVREGDILWKPGHVVYAVSPSQIAEAAFDENGGITGGQDGNQTGQETRITGNYGGWTRLIRPKTTTPTTPTTPTNGGKEVKIYTFRDGRAARKDGVKIDPDKHIFLHRNKDAKTGSGESIIGAVGAYDSTVQVDVRGTAGDVLAVRYVLKDKDGNLLAYGSWMDTVIPARGYISSHLNFKRKIVGGNRLFLQARGAASNKKPLTLVNFTVDSYQYTA